MTTLLLGISNKAAERWAALLLGPGLLFVMCLVIARHSGFRHAVDLRYLRTYLNAFAGARADQQPAELLTALLLVTALATAAGAAAASAGRTFERAWIPDRPHWYVTVLTHRRIRRWTTLTRAIQEARDQRVHDHLHGTTPNRRRPTEARLLEQQERRFPDGPPDRPTWTAQRMATAAGRVRQRYGVELAEIWPHIWAVADSEARKDIQGVRDGYADAGRLAAWGTAYLLVTVSTGWWPASVIGAVLVSTAVLRARAAIDALATLAEAAVDLNIRKVAEQLGIACQAGFDVTAATSLNAVLRPRPSITP
ncbi:hypothetical protein [Kitasatospora sp. MBT63]|uniref:hypothetical protein n=1 Tax=Kitasatospora sp. MBT63 TaxID=1444768 RepID=UPI00053B355C|nr:hypothetical protein [Kitasatospora sp. MBT63]